MNSKLKKYLTLIVLGLAGGSIYIFPYLKYVFYDPLIEVLHISDTQSGLLLTMYAIGCVILYIPGGILADKMNPKKALIMSLSVATILTAIFAVVILLELPGSVAYAISLVIWLLMAFASGFVFWTALLKAIRIIGTEDEQGRMYGIYYAANGTTAAIIAAVNLWVYNAGGGDANMKMGFFWAVVSMALFTLLATILVGIFLEGKTDKDLSTAEEDKFHFGDVLTVVKNPAVWLISIVFFCVYGVYSCSSYFTPYLTDVIQLSTTAAGVCAILRQYVVMLVAAPLGGILADKVFKSTLGWFRFGGLILAISIVLVILAGSGAPAIFVAVLTLIPGLFSMCLYGVMFSTMHEINIPVKVAGTAIGVASIIGYLPDMFLNTIFGNILDKSSGAGGYFQIFGILAAFCVIVVVICSYLYVKNVKPAKKAN
jgi:nitrate/nitrite transporter NarK